MNPRIVGLIIGKDVRQGLRSSMFIFVLVSPFIYTFFIGMIFGGFVGEGRPPTLGVVDLGDSDLVPMMKESEGLVTRIYTTESNMINAVENNVVDGGMVLAADFDETLLGGKSPNLDIHYSGKSYASNRLNIQNSVTKLIRQFAGQEVPISINTTILGSEKALRMKDRVMEEVKRLFKPEFINRIDEIIVFHPLNKEHMKDIVSIMLKDIMKRTIEQMNISLIVEEDAKDYLIQKGYDEKYGARPLRRTIQNSLEDKLAEEILSGTVKNGDEVVVSADTEGLKFSVRELVK